MGLSSLAFIAVMGLLNADGNITSIDLQKGYGQEGNVLAQPLASGDLHYVNTAIGVTSCILVHDKLKEFDKQLGLNEFGTKDVLTIGIGVTEFFTIRSWDRYEGKGGADIGAQIALSEAEFFVTSQVLHLEF